jgi:hypothetical protein
MIPRLSIWRTSLMLNIRKRRKKKDYTNLIFNSPQELALSWKHITEILK